MDNAPVMNDFSYKLLNKMMQLSYERQSVIANNLANADTPGYVRRELDFEDQLASLIKSDQDQQVPHLQGEMVEDEKSPARLDGNNVVLYKEMDDMMQNTVMYQLLTRAFNTKVSILKSAMEAK